MWVKATPALQQLQDGGRFFRYTCSVFHFTGTLSRQYFYCCCRVKAVITLTKPSLPAGPEYIQYCDWSCFTSLMVLSFTSHLYSSLSVLNVLQVILRYGDSSKIFITYSALNLMILYFSKLWYVLFIFHFDLMAVEGRIVFSGAKKRSQNQSYFLSKTLWINYQVNWKRKGRVPLDSCCFKDGTVCSIK